MEENRKHIDNLFKEELGGYTETPPPPAWVSLEKRLNADRRKRRFPYGWFWYIGIVSFIAVLGAGGAWEMMHNMHNNAEVAVATNHKVMANKQEAANMAITQASENQVTHSNKNYKAVKKHHVNNIAAFASSTKAPGSNVNHTSSDKRKHEQTNTTVSNTGKTNDDLYADVDDDQYTVGYSSNSRKNGPSADDNEPGYVVTERSKSNIVVAETDPVQHVSSNNYSASTSSIQGNAVEGLDVVAAHKPASPSHTLQPKALQVAYSQQQNASNHLAVRERAKRRLSVTKATSRDNVLADNAASKKAHGKSTKLSNVSKAAVAAPLTTASPVASSAPVPNKNELKSTASTANIGGHKARLEANRARAVSMHELAVDKPVAKKTVVFKQPVDKLADNSNKQVASVMPGAKAKLRAEEAAVAKKKGPLKDAFATVKNTAEASQVSVQLSRQHSTTNARSIGTKATPAASPKAALAVSATHSNKVIANASRSTAKAPLASALAQKSSLKKKSLQGNTVKPTRAVYASANSAKNPKQKKVAIFPSNKVNAEKPGKTTAEGNGIAAKISVATTTKSAKSKQQKAALSVAQVNTTTSVTVKPIIAGPTATAQNKANSAVASNTASPSKKGAARKSAKSNSKSSKAAPAVATPSPANLYASSFSKPTIEDDAATIDNLKVNTYAGLQPLASGGNVELSGTFKEEIGKAKVDSATNNPVIDTSSKRHRFAKRFEIGIKGGYESAFSKVGANKFVASPYIQYNLSEKFALMTQPSMKVSQLGNYNIGKPGSYINTIGGPKTTLMDSGAVIIFYGSSSGAPTAVTEELREYNYTQLYDSVVKSNSLKRTYTEFELPLLLKYKIYKQLSIYGGANMIYGKSIGIQQDTYTSGNMIKTATGATLAAFNAAAPSLPPSASVLQFGNPYLSAYKNPYPSPQESLLRFGYMLGFSYEYKKRWLFDVLIQQASAKANYEGGYNTNAALSLPYFRFTVGYKLTK